MRYRSGYLPKDHGGLWIAADDEDDPK